MLSAQKSIAIYLEALGDKEDIKYITTELHCTLWDLSGEKESDDEILELGVLLKPSLDYPIPKIWTDYLKNVKHIHLWIPSLNINPECLFHKLSEEHNALYVFNKPVTTKPNVTAKSTLIKFAHTPFEDITLLKISDDNTVRNDNNNSHIIINFSDIITTSSNHLTANIYLRIQLKLKKNFMCDYNPPTTIFSPEFCTTKIVEFKINERRNIEKYIHLKMQEPSCAINIDKIVFIFITSIKSDICESYQPIHKSRIIEDGIWEKYLDLNNNSQREITFKEKLALYHWKKETNIKDYIDDFSAYIKVKQMKNVISIYLRYFIASSLLCSILYDIIKVISIKFIFSIKLLFSYIILGLSLLCVNLYDIIKFLFHNI